MNDTSAMTVKSIGGVSFGFRRQLGTRDNGSLDLKLTGDRRANEADYSLGVQLNLTVRF